MIEKHGNRILEMRAEYELSYHHNGLIETVRQKLYLTLDGDLTWLIARRNQGTEVAASFFVSEVGLDGAVTLICV